jgi:hypothetical protein
MDGFTIIYAIFPNCLGKSEYEKEKLDEVRYVGKLVKWNPAVVFSLAWTTFHKSDVKC